MADRPMASTSKAGRSRMRSVHLPIHKPVACKAARPRAKSVYKAKVKGNSKKKLGNTARMMPPHSCQTTTEEVEPIMLKLIMIRF